MIVLQTTLIAHLRGGTALTALLSAGTASIYTGRAGRDATLPYVVVTFTDSDRNRTPRRERPHMADIKAIATDGNTASMIDDAIDTLMKTEIDVTGWDTVWQRRTFGIEFQEDVDGKTFWHDGGRYDIELAEH